MAAARSVTVRVKPRRIVYIDGRSHSPGAVVETTRAHAGKLVAADLAEQIKKGGRS